MKRVKKFLKEHGIISVVLVAILTFSATAFGYIIKNEKENTSQSKDIVELQKTDMRIEDWIKRIEPVLVDIRLDVREVKTIVENKQTPFEKEITRIVKGE